MTTKTLTALAVACAFGLSLLAIPAAATGTTGHGNHGTVKVHDEMSVSPPSMNQPHVDCDFWVEGFDLAGSSGYMRFYAWPPTGDKSLVMTTDWTGTLEGDGRGYHFNVGPLALPSGHYRLEVYSNEGHPGDAGHFVKAKMFWVECETPGPTPSPTPTPTPPPTSPPPSSPPPQVCEDTDLPTLTAYHYVIGNVTYAHIPADLEAGTTVSVIFTLEGCNERVLSFVSYHTTADFNLPEQTVFDAETGTFGEGTWAMDIEVPPCYYQIDFVYGAVIVVFNPDAGITYHDEGRFIDGVQGSNSTCAPPPPPTPCPTNVEAVANAGGSVTLSFDVAAGTDAVTVLRAEGGGDYEVVATLAGNATTYTDTDTTVGVSYSYLVVATANGLVSEDCTAVTVTSVPVFGTTFALGAAVAGLAAAGMIVLRRRK
jgi:hypothetical protein